MAQFNFDATNEKTLNDRSALPAGWYNVIITNSEIKENAAKNGSYILFTFKVLDGEHANRQIFNILNINHPNATAVQIAKQELSTICHVTNVLKMNDTQQLHGIPFKIKLTLTKSEQYGEQNNIVAYEEVAGGAVAPNNNFNNFQPNTPQWLNAPQVNNNNNINNSTTSGGGDIPY